ncbi:MAG: ribonuclease ribonuclease [Candidatus Parcubacteria bacterium]|jgi:ribonuclease HII
MKKNQKRPELRRFKWLVGIDEVGRGPLAGPVAVCASLVRFDDLRKDSGKINASLRKLMKFSSSLKLTDSKKLSLKQRGEWFDVLKSSEKGGHIYFSLEYASAQTIDAKGIAVCIKSLVNKNLKKLQKKINFSYDDVLVLLDGGLKAPTEFIHQETIIKGDEKEAIISYASIIAKVSRDEYMKKLSKKYPEYGFDIHKGYGTLAHRIAIQKNGVSNEHRVSFLSSIIGSMK